MKKIKRGIIISLLLVIMFFLENKSSYAVSFTADAKGYKTIGLTYLGDEVISNHTIYSDSNTFYGSMGMWVANYKYVTKTSDGADIAYYVVFIEAYIQSKGQDGKYFFRNKKLTIDYKTKIWSGTDGFDLIKHSSGTDASVSLSNGWSIDASIEGEVSSSGPAVGLSVGASFSNTTTVSYPSVTMTPSVYDDGGWSHVRFDFDFSGWKNGKMTSPNVGKVDQNVFLVYQVKGYKGIEIWNADIDVEATIFKDAKWPKKNGTVSDKIHLSSLDGKVINFN